MAPPIPIRQCVFALDSHARNGNYRDPRGRWPPRKAKNNTPSQRLAVYDWGKGHEQLFYGRGSGLIPPPCLVASAHDRFLDCCPGDRSGYLGLEIALTSGVLAPRFIGKDEE